ncbi:hypothetical protein BH09PLA1_BH09PLA1_17990 [soil metagenome]
MAASDRITHRDISALLKLGNELHELPSNISARHEHMLGALGKLLRAWVGVSVMGRMGPPSAPEKLDLCMLVKSGWKDPRERRTANEYYRTLLPVNPLRGSILSMSREEPVATYRREQLVEDGDWYRSAYFEQRHQAMGVDHSIYSVMSFEGSRLVTAIAVHRAKDDRRRFTERECSLLRMFHSQAQWIYECDPPARGSRVTIVLSPRQKQTLRLLLGGDAEKQIAAKLSLSRNTVHEHVKTIYRSIGVSSRNELLARFMRRG